MADDTESTVEVEMEISLASLASKLANNATFLAKVRSNQLKRARAQTNIYGKYAQRQKAQQQTRKIT